MKTTITLLLVLSVLDSSFGQYSYNDHMRNKKMFADSTVESYYKNAFAPSWSIGIALDQVVPTANDLEFDTHTWDQATNSWRPVSLESMRQTADAYGHLRTGLATNITVSFDFDPFKNRALRITTSVILRHYQVKYGGSVHSVINSKYFAEGVTRFGIQISPFTWIALAFRRKDYRWKPGVISGKIQNGFTPFLSNELLTYSFLVDRMFSGRYDGLLQIRHQIENTPATMYISRMKGGVVIKLSFLFSYVSEKTLEGKWVSYMEYSVKIRTSVTQEFKRGYLSEFW